MFPSKASLLTYTLHFIHPAFFIFFIFFIFIFFSHTMWQFSHQGSNPSPRQGEFRVLTMGPTENSHSSLLEDLTTAIISPLLLLMSKFLERILHVHALFFLIPPFSHWFIFLHILHSIGENLYMLWEQCEWWELKLTYQNLLEEAIHHEKIHKSVLFWKWKKWHLFLTHALSH